MLDGPCFACCHVLKVQLHPLAGRQALAGQLEERSVVPRAQRQHLPRPRGRRCLLRGLLLLLLGLLLLLPVLLLLLLLLLELLLLHLQRLSGCPALSCWLAATCCCRRLGVGCCHGVAITGAWC